MCAHVSVGGGDTYLVGVACIVGVKPRPASICAALRGEEGGREEEGGKGGRRE